MSLCGSGGMNNIRQVIIMSAVVASVLNRTLLLPRTLPNRHARPVATNKLWNVELLSRLLPAGAVIMPAGLEPSSLGPRARLSVNPWCCDVTADDIRSSPQVIRSRFVPVVSLGSENCWVFPSTFFAPSLARLVRALSGCVRSDISRCAARLTARLDTRLDGAGTLHAMHLRVGDKTPCPLLQCEDCGWVSRSLRGFQDNNCDCKWSNLSTAAGGSGSGRRSGAARPADGEAPPPQLSIEQYWRVALAGSRSGGQKETNAILHERSPTMGEHVECAMRRSRVQRGDSVYVATNAVAVEAHVEQLTTHLGSLGVRRLTWGDLAPLLVEECPWLDANLTADGSVLSFMEQLLCANAPGHFFSHFYSSWDEQVLYLRTLLLRYRASAVTTDDAIGQHALFSSKVRAALDGTLRVRHVTSGLGISHAARVEPVSQGEEEGSNAFPLPLLPVCKRCFDTKLESAEIDLGSVLQAK